MFTIKSAKLCELLSAVCIVKLVAEGASFFARTFVEFPRAFHSHLHFIVIAFPQFARTSERCARIFGPTELAIERAKLEGNSRILRSCAFGFLQPFLCSD